MFKCLQNKDDLGGWQLFRTCIWIVSVHFKTTWEGFAASWHSPESDSCVMGQVLSSVSDMASVGKVSQKKSIQCSVAIFFSTILCWYSSAKYLNIYLLSVMISLIALLLKFTKWHSASFFSYVTVEVVRKSETPDTRNVIDGRNKWQCIAESNRNTYCIVKCRESE